MSEQKSTEIVLNNETKIRTEKYEQQKNKLKKFSSKVPGKVELKTVPQSKGPFGLADYKVTGSDYNKLAENIQDLLIEQNKNTTKIIREFSTIYETFTILDNDYIKRIIINLQVSQDANDKARESLEQLKEEQKKTETNQREISQLLTQQETVVKVLQNYKKKLEEIKHLDDIDTLYSEAEKIKNDILVHTIDLNNQLEKTNQLSLRLSNSEQQITNIYKNISEQSKDILYHGKQITDLEKSTKESESEITSLYTKTKKYQNIQDARTEELEEKQLNITKKTILLADAQQIHSKNLSKYEQISSDQLALIDLLEEKIKTEMIYMRTINENMRKWMIINYVVTFILITIMIYLGTR